MLLIQTPAQQNLFHRTVCLKRACGQASRCASLTRKERCDGSRLGIRYTQGGTTARPTRTQASAKVSGKKAVRWSGKIGGQVRRRSSGRGRWSLVRFMPNVQIFEINEIKLRDQRDQTCLFEINEINPHLVLQKFAFCVTNPALRDRRPICILNLKFFQSTHQT